MEPKKTGINGVTIDGEMSEVRFTLNKWGSDGGSSDEKIVTSDYTIDCSGVRFSEDNVLYINNVTIDVLNKTITASSNVYE